MEYTRIELIDICERAFVPQSDWSDRDSASSQMKVGQALALLKAGCHYQIKTKENVSDGSRCITDSDTIWIQFWVKDFSWFEYHDEEANEIEGNNKADYHFYLPTDKRLKKTKGKDWY